MRQRRKKSRSAINILVNASACNGRRGGHDEHCTSAGSLITATRAYGKRTEKFKKGGRGEEDANKFDAVNKINLKKKKKRYEKGFSPKLNEPARSCACARVCEEGSGSRARERARAQGGEAAFRTVGVARARAGGHRRESFGRPRGGPSGGTLTVRLGAAAAVRSPKFANTPARARARPPPQPPTAGTGGSRRKYTGFRNTNRIKYPIFSIQQRHAGPTDTVNYWKRTIFFFFFNTVIEKFGFAESARNRGRIIIFFFM